MIHGLGQLKPNADAAVPKHAADSTASRFETCKRVVDVALALVALLLLAPLMTGCAIWIKMIDPGPVLYSQWRVGRDGWLFRIYKLRTMYLDAEKHGVQYAKTNDRRILPGCRWMRKSHVDELPQLLNILQGHMSLVGPRPERPEMLEQLRPMIPRIDHRHVGRPGLTGLAQVNNGYTNDLNGARAKLAYDLRYLRRRSLFQNFKLMLQTLTKVWDPSAL